MGVATFFIILASLMTILDIIIAVFIFKKQIGKGKYLFGACISATIAAIAYTLSASFKNYTLASAFSSLYFISIDFIVVFLMAFTYFYTGGKVEKNFTIVGLLMKLYILAEIILFITNIFVDDLVISYSLRNEEFAMYSYQMRPMYYIHLTFTYSLVLVSLFYLAKKAFSVPKEYRAQYSIMLWGIVIIVLLNAVFLFLPKDNVWGQADYSVLLYSICALICYWSSYIYPRRNMLFNFKNYVFSNIDQGILLFDYENRLIIHNSKSERFFSSLKLEAGLPLQSFLDANKISIKKDEDAYSLQCYIQSYGKEIPLRCDYRRLINDRNQFIGNLLVFADAQLETDLLTSFHHWESFRKFAIENERNFPIPTTVAVCDINQMTLYNTIHGRNQGDQLLKNLADLLRKIFSEDSYFVRGQDAYLFAICYNKTEDEIKRGMQEVSGVFEKKIQYSIASAIDSDKNLLDIMKRSMAGLKARKLLDKEATSSALLNSLVKALQECDSDTESHVARTQKMGAELGKRLKLSDVELSKLSLLCLLHDIGKIGVPLEILNKPGKLTDDEWIVIKSHVIKGESIAKSSPDLSNISNEIRLHHERWDGRGYPDGLSKESIPILSRIICVVDAFDAMVNHRSYRRALSIEYAKEEIIKCAGTQFDPFIAKEFIAMLDEGYNVELNSDSVVVQTTNISLNEAPKQVKNVHPMNYAKYILNSDMRIIEIDSLFTEITGYTKENITDKIIRQSDLLPKEDRTEYVFSVMQQLGKNPMALIEHRLLCKDGSIKYVYCLGRKYFDSVAREEKSEIIIVNSTSTYSAKLMADTMEEKSRKQLKTWEETYRRDSLTGLLNHVAFVNDLENKAMTLSPKLNYMVIMLDLDNFKKFNDTYGHHAGDEFLIHIAQAIQSCLKMDDLACRMGGDEFMMAIFFNKDYDYKMLANNIFNKISMRLSAMKHFTSFSMGVAIKTSEFNSFDDIYEAADRIMYESKDLGKNCISFYEGKEV